MKRPMGWVCLLFILFICLFYVAIPPSLPDYSSINGREVYINGQVTSINLQEIQGETQTVYTLSDVILRESSVGVDHFYTSEKEASSDSRQAAGEILNTSDKNNSNQVSIYIQDKITCYTSQRYSEIHIGSRVWFRGSFQNYKPIENPGQFDSQFYYHIQGMGGTLKEAKLVWSDEREDVLRERLQRCKHFFIQRLNGVFTEEYAGVMKAMLYGDKAELNPHIKKLFQEGGILHILSISGMHISMLGMAAFRLLRKCKIPKRGCAAAGLIVILLYGAMIGTGASTFRAICMFAMQMAAIFIGRTYDRLTGLSVAAVLLLLDQPLYIFYSGFLLSFGAVLGITIVPTLLTRLCKDKGRIVKWVCRILGSSIGVLLTTLPIQLFFYYEYPIYSIVVNVLIMPFISYIIGLGLVLSVLPESLPVIVELSVWICEKLLQLYKGICGWSQTLPAHCLVLGAPTIWQIVIYYICLIGMLWYMQWYLESELKHDEKNTKLRGFGIRSLPVVLLLFIGAFYLLLCRPVNGFYCHFLSVGQGDCAVIRYQKNAYIVDCGSTSNLNVGNQILLPFLKYYGISKVDGIFISHADADHINGILQWLEEYEHSHIRISRIILPSLSEDILQEEFNKLLELAHKRDILVVTLAAGERLNIGELTIKVLNPEVQEQEIEDANNASQVLLFEYQGQHILMTGDIGEVQELKILDQIPPDSKIEVLKAAHHGSRFSSSMKFLKRCHPERIVLSYGLGNSYGHPHKAAVERMEEVGAKLYRTPKSGTVTVYVQDGNIDVQEFLK